MLYFQGFKGILGGIVVIFDGVKSGENGVKWSFCRTHYRTRKWGRGVGTSDMPFLASGYLL